MNSALAILWQQRDVMLSGLLTTLEISVAGALLAAIFGVLIFVGLISRMRVIRLLLLVLLVDTMRCVPFMLFCYLLYYGLPYAGITLGNLTVGIAALSIYHASYIAEILRAAWKEQPADIKEASIAFGFHGVQRLRIILPPVVIATIPMLGNSAIQIIKDSAFLVIIAVQELTFAANEIQSTYYVPFASFICAVFFYWFLCLIVEGGTKLISVRTLLRR
jgi:polar amino acid transport system permease protein